MFAGKKLMSNTFYLFLNTISLAVLSFLFWFANWHVLDPSDSGIVYTAQSLTVYITPILLLATPMLLPKLIPELMAKKQQVNINSLMTFILIIVFITMAAMLFLFIFFPSNVAALLNIPQDVLLIIFVLALLYSLNMLFGQAIYGYQNMKILFYSDVLYSILKVALSVMLVVIGFSYFGPIMGLALASIFALLYRIKFVPLKLNFDFTYIFKNKILSRFAFPGLISVIAEYAPLYLAPIMLTAIVSPSATGIYGLALTATAQIAIVSRFLLQAFFPLASELSVDRSKKGTQSYLLSMVFRYSLFTLLPIASVLLVFSKYVIPIVSKGGEYFQAVELFPMLSIAAIFYAIGSIFICTLYAISKTKIFSKIYVVYATIFLVFAYSLTILYSSYGMAMAYLISTVFIALTSYYYLRKYIRLQIAFKSVFKIFLSTAIMLAFLYISSLFIDNLYLAITIGGISVIVYLLSSLLLKFYTKEDVFIIEFFANKLPEPLRDYLLRFTHFLSKFI